jgi:ATP-dependent DNA helicase RecQ
MNKMAERCSWKVCFEKALNAVLSEINPINLTSKQRESLDGFLNGKDVFTSLPTGHGKSLIFQLTIPLIRHLKQIDPDTFVSRYPENPLLIMIAPLQALMSDQISSCEKLGLKAAKLDEIEAIHGKHNIIFTSPETLAGHLTTIKNHQECIAGIVVDESHCVVNWYVNYFFRFDV